jgi:hypothetical protein
VTATCPLAGTLDAGPETTYHAYLYRLLGKHHSLLNYTTANEGSNCQIPLVNKSPFPPDPFLTDLLPFEFMIGGRTR